MRSHELDGMAARRAWAERLGDSFPVYLLGLAGTVLGLLLLYIGSLMALERTGDLPPPAIVNSICADAKLAFLRDHPPASPTHLIVGSSIAWRNVDSAQLVARDPQIRPLNAGFCGAQLNQAAFAARFLIEQYPSVRTVLAVLEPHDMRACSKTPDQLFDPADTDAYINDRRWLYGFYLRYFDPISFARNVRKIHHRRLGIPPDEGLSLNQYGDSPTHGNTNGDLVYRAFEGYDPSCFADLRQLAADLSASGRELIVATSPINPRWSDLHDRGGEIRRALASRIATALAGTGGRFWDGERHDLTPPVPEFSDAVHLTPPGARRYSRRLAAAVIAPGPGL